MQQKEADSVPKEIGLRDLLMDLWRARLLAVCIVFMCAGGGALIGWIMTDQYEASITVIPVSNQSGANQMAGLGEIVSRYSGIASLAGVALYGNGTKEESVAVLESELLTESFIRENNLLPILYSRIWEEKLHKWKTSNPRRIPSLWMANRYFKTNIRQVSEDKTTGIVVMKIRWRDPVLAAEWANTLVRKTNEFLRDKAILESERNISYLSEEAAKTNVVEVKSVIYSILQQEIDKGMLAKGREEFALKVIDPAVAPGKPSSPSAVLLSFIGFIVGCGATILVVVVRKLILEK
jgi:uncharacterized protein involved in exopolysaccharide biosynthesis